MTTKVNTSRILQKGDRVWVVGLWYKGTVRSHNWNTGRYFLEMDDRPGMRFHQKFIYRNRDEIMKCGGV